MSSKEDVLKYPCYSWVRKGLIIMLKEPPTEWQPLFTQCHHYIEQRWIKTHPEEFKKIEHLQKLFFLPAEMHADLHAGCRRFKEKWGVEREELLYKLRRNNANN